MDGEYILWMQPAVSLTIRWTRSISSRVLELRDTAARPSSVMSMQLTVFSSQ